MNGDSIGKTYTPTYGGATPYENMDTGNSGLNQLITAVGRINGVYTVGAPAASASGDPISSGGYTELEDASRESQSISHSFQNVSGQLSAGWSSVADFFMAIDIAMREKTGVLYSSIMAYAELSIERKQREARDINTATDAVSDIAKEIDI